MTRPLRLAYLATDSGIGGAEKQVHDLAVAMHARGWQTHAISMLPIEELFADLPSIGITTSTLDMTGRRGSVRALWRLHRLLHIERPHILHSHMVHANLLARLVTLMHPSIVLVNTMHNQYQGGHWRRVAYRLTDRLSDRTTAVSQVALDAAVQQRLAPRSRLVMMPNGVDTTRYADDAQAREEIRRSLAPAGEFLWLAAGRLTAAKDYPNLITAFARIKDSDSGKVRLVIAGEGPLEESVRSLISESGLADRVRLLGPRDDVPSLMQAADGFVMSSAWEGLPMVLLEAAASALPAVATDAGGNREAIVDGVTGHIVPSHDPDALAQAMSRVREQPPEARRAMGLAARMHVSEGFDIEAVADRWSALYLDLLGKHT